jgi:hypothetical protein
MRALAIAGMCVLALVVGLALPGGAWAVGRKVAVTGDPAPGFTDGYLWQMFGSPWLNESGQVGFYCDVANGGSGSSGIFLYDSAGGWALVRSGDPAPGGGTIAFPMAYAMNDAGQTAFFGSVMPSGPSGLFRADGISITPLVRAGDPAPGTGGGTVGVFGPSTQPSLNASGQSALAVQVLGGTASAAIYRADGLSLTPVAVEGQAAPVPGGATFIMLNSTVPVLANGGNVAFMSTLMGPPPGRDSGLFIQDDGTLALLAQGGDTAPGTSGATFGPFGAMPGNTIAIAGHDKVAARVDLTGGPGGPNQGIFLWSGGVAAPVALQNQAAPEGNGVFDNLFAPVINDAGQVAFKAALTASANPAQDGEGLYRATGSTLTMMARKANVSPDGNGKFSNLGNPVLSSTGQIAFEADLTMTAGAGSDDHGIFISDGVDIVKVAREGEIIPGTYYTASAVQLGNNMFDVRSDMINAYGQVAFRASSSGMGTGVFLFTPELSWRSTASGSWDTSANWTLGLQPAYVHPVNIYPGTSLTVTGPAGAVTVDSLGVGGEAVLDLAAGGSLTVNNSTFVAGGGTLRLASGSLQTPYLLIFGGMYDGAGGTLAAGYINQVGGTVNGTLLNTGQFSYSGGAFAGRLVNQGTVTLNSNFTAGNGMENDAPFSLWYGLTVALNGAGLDNQSDFIFMGGTLTGSGTLTNNGNMRAYSDFMVGLQSTIRIAGTGGFVNNALFSNSSGVDVFLTNTGSNVNYGMMGIEGGTLHLDGGAALTNHGALGVNNAAIVGTGALTNAADGAIGTINGPGIISVPFSNAGQVTVSQGALRIQQAFTNSGTIDLAGDAANLQGGAINNTGAVQGRGHLSNDVSNSGIIEPVGGVLLMSGAFVNNSAGRVNVAAGTKVRVTSAPSPNAGIISIQGGSVEFTQAFTNAPGGLISGRGTLSVGGTGLMNNGNVGFSGGFADVYGDVTNNTGAKIVISGGSTATFYDDVDAAGGEIRVSQGCAVVFFGSYNGGTTGIGGTVYMEGDLRPGHSPGSVAFEGDLVLGSGAHLVAELAGTAPGAQYDQVSVGGLAALGGTLDVVLLGGFSPEYGDTFNLFDFGDFARSFDVVNLPALSGGLAWDASGLYSAGSIQVMPEPATLALAGLGLAASLLRRRRRG